MVDVDEVKVLRIAYISAGSIQRILLSKQYAWIQVSCGVDVANARSWDAGNAWTGVYRIERAAVEPAN